MSSSVEPGWPVMKYGTRYCSLPAFSLDWQNACAKRSYDWMPGFFIFASTLSFECSGATESCPPVWCLASASMNSGLRSAKS